MSHNVETMAYAGEVPWHGLGEKVPADLTTEQFMRKAGLDWKVEKETITTSSGAEVHGKRALVRQSDNTVLDIVGSNWNPVQNSEAFDFFTEYVNAGDMEMHTAGSLKNGEIVWALAKTKDSFELFNGDVTDNYFLFTNPHKFGKCIDIRMTPVRVVCNNTLTLSLNQSTDKMLTVNHRKPFDAEEVKQQMGIAREKMEQYKTMAQFLGKKRYTAENVTAYFNDVFGENSRNASLAHDNLQTQPGAKYGEGSWWQAFNAVTYMTDHLQGRENDSRLVSAWYGRNRKVKLNALDKALEYAEVA